MAFKPFTSFALVATFPGVAVPTRDTAADRVQDVMAIATNNIINTIILFFIFFSLSVSETVFLHCDSSTRVFTGQDNFNR
jgi:hypothetical protein